MKNVSARKFLITFITLLSVVPMARSSEMIDGIWYWFYEDYAAVAYADGYNPDFPSQGTDNTYSGDVVIPSAVQYQGQTYPVRKISNYAFSNCSGLHSVSVPKSVTEILSYAFSNCENLESVLLPEGLDSLGDGAFAGCKSLSSITLPETLSQINYATFRASGLTTITIPENISVIGSWAFSGCKSLTSIRVEEGVLEIEQHAFNQCEGLMSVALPNSLQKIGNAAFSDCTGLAEVKMGNSLQSIGEWAFSNTGLKAVTLPNSVKTISSSFYNCTQLSSVVLGNGVETLEGTFENCTALTTMELPESIVTMRGAFRGCTALLSIMVPNSAKDISNAFMNCAYLATVRIGDGVEQMDGAFNGCTSLTSIEIPNSVVNMPNAFRNCVMLKEAVIPNSVKDIASAFSGCENLSKASIGASVETINQAFYQCSSLSEIVLPVGVTDTGDRSFEGCSSLKSVTLGEKTEIIGSNSFFGCEALTGMHIPASLKQIQDGAFANSGIRSLELGENVTEIGEGAFSGCSNLRSITIPNRVASIAPRTFHNDTQLKYVAFGEAIKSIGDDAFRNTGIEEVILPNAVTEIGDRAFYGCSVMHTLKIGPNVRKIGDEAFLHCPGLKWVRMYSENPSLITVSGTSNFSWSANATLQVPKGSVATYKGIEPWNKFRNITDNTCLVSGNGIYEVGVDDNATLLGWRDLDAKEVIVPDRIAESSETAGSIASVETLGSIAFSDMKLLASVTLPSTCKTIEALAFAGCSRLETINVSSSSVVTLSADGAYAGEVGKAAYMPDELESIGDRAFSNCYALTAFILNGKCNRLGEGVFVGCRSMSTLRSKCVVPPTAQDATFAESADGDFYKNVTLYVPTGCMEAYQKAEGWKNFTNVKEWDISGIDDIHEDSIEVVAREGTISVKNAEQGTLIEVYNTGGLRMYRGFETEITGLASGIYIVKVGDQGFKVMLSFR